MVKDSGRVEEVYAEGWRDEMNETMEQIALRVAKEMEWLQAPHQPDIQEFARRFAAALGAQEPVSYREIESVVLGIAPVVKKFYAAPVVPAGWQMVPKEPTPEMMIAAEKQAGVDAGLLRPMQPLDSTTWRNSALNRYKAMLAAAPKEPT